jgi:hypothetical protein
VHPRDDPNIVQLVHDAAPRVRPAVTAWPPHRRPPVRRRHRPYTSQPSPALPSKTSLPPTSGWPAGQVRACAGRPAGRCGGELAMRRTAHDIPFLPPARNRSAGGGGFERTLAPPHRCRCSPTTRHAPRPAQLAPSARRARARPSPAGRLADGCNLHCNRPAGSRTARTPPRPRQRKEIPHKATSRRDHRRRFAPAPPPAAKRRRIGADDVRGARTCAFGEQLVREWDV